MYRHILVTLFYYLPEGILLALAGLGLFGVKAPRSRILLTGVVYGLAIPLARGLGWPFGFHTILLLLWFTILARQILRIGALTAVAGWVVGVYILSVGEQFVLFPLLQVCRVDLPSVLSNPVSHVAWGWVSLVPLAIVTSLVTLTRVVLIPAPNTPTAHSQQKD